MKKQILSLAAASLLSFSVQANDISYDYAEIGFMSIDPDDSGESLDGFYLSGTKQINEGFHLFGTFDSTSLEEGADEVDFSKLQLGLGYNSPISATTDLVAQAGLTKNNVEFCEIFANGSQFCEKENDSGLAINFGVRALISPEFEIKGRIKYEDVWTTGNTTNFEIGGTYIMPNNIAINGSFEFGEFAPRVDANTLRIGLRYNF